MTSKEVKALLIEKVPIERQDFPDFKFILTIISNNKIATVEQLQSYLNKNVLALESKLSRQKGANPTINRKRVKVAKALDSLRLCQRLVKDYLS